LDVQTSATGTAAGDNTAGYFGSLASGRDVNIRFGDSANASARIGYLSGALYMYTNGAERLRLDLSGNLGLGVTPSAWGGGYKAFQITNDSRSLAATGAGAGDLTLAFNAVYDSTDSRWEYTTTGDKAGRYSQTGAGNHAWYVTNTSGTAGNAITFTQAMTLDASGNLLVGLTTGAKFSVSYGGNDTHFGLGANYDNYITAGSSGVTIFRNTSTERARIDSSGNLLVGTTSQATNARVTIDGGSIVANAPTSTASGTDSFSDNGGSPNTLRLYNSTDSNNTGNRFLICDAAASVLRAEIRSNGGIANYQGNDVNLSDRREKTNFAPAKSYLNVICAIPVQTFNYIDQNMEEDGGLTLGVVAQDVQAVAPELVMESNWGTKDQPKMRLSIYQTDLQYALMKCIQEQQAIIESLKARLDAANL
jgi:hypothetical protein